MLTAAAVLAGALKLMPPSSKHAHPGLWRLATSQTRARRYKESVEKVNQPANLEVYRHLKSKRSCMMQSHKQQPAASPRQ